MLTLRNCTLSGNSTSKGGGIYGYVNAAVTRQNCTVSGHSAYGGSGIYSGASATLTMTHTLMARGGYETNFFWKPNSVTNFGYNVSDDVSAAAFATTYLNLFLGPLTNNGDPTLTHTLLPGSPAVDAGNPNFTAPPYYDQRGPGFPRVFNGIIDIGALEAQTIMAFAPVLENPVWFATGRNFGFTFKNVSGVTFSVVATTNLAVPMTDWTVLGSVIEVSPGQYQFTGPQDTNAPQRFYRVSSP